MNKQLLHIVLFFCLTQQFYSQEDGIVAFDIPVRNSLKFNRYIINPTFSFVREQNKYISFTNKREWVQFDDAPQTYLFSYSGRFRENIGVGIGAFQQDYGVLTTFGGVLNFAYNAVINRDNNLTFGMNLGFYQSGINQGRVVTNFPDPSLNDLPTNSILTINPGINYGTEFFDFGLSVNNAVSYNFNTSKIIEDNPEQGLQAHVMYTGYVNSRGFFDESKFSGLLTSEFKKDNTIISGIIMLTVPKGIWGQAGYNSLYGMSAGVGVNISKQIALEYNYEKAMGDLSAFGNSHDITVAYKFKNNNRYNYSGDDEEEALLSGKKSRRVVAKPKGTRVTETDRIAIAKAKEEAKAQAKERVKEKAEARAKLIEASKARREAKIQEVALKKAAKAQEAEKAKLNESLNIKTQESEEERLKLEEETKTKEIATIKLEEEEKAKAAEVARIKLEAEKIKLAEEARLKEEEAIRIKLAEETRIKRIEEVKAEEIAKTKLEEEAKAKVAEVARIKLEAEKIRLAEEAKLKEEETRIKRIEEAKAEAVAKVKLEEEKKAKAAEVARINLEVEKIKLAEESKLKEQEANRVKLADEAKIKLAEGKAKAEEVAKVKLEEKEKARKEVESKAKLVEDKDPNIEVIEEDAIIFPFEKDEEIRKMNDLTKLTVDSKLKQENLLIKLREKVASKQKDLDELKEENDLSEQGIFKAPKPFKSISAENAALASLKLEIDDAIKSQNEKINELESLYKERLKTVSDRNDTTNVFYQKAINELKSGQLQIMQSKERLNVTLEEIKVATEFERKRRIKRAAYDNEEDRYVKDRSALKQIKQFTPRSSEPLKEEDFDFGEELSNNIQIVKDVKNIENGYYLVIAVHSDVSKRDEFLTKAISLGQNNIDFFYDVNTSKYYIYYNNFNGVEDARKALQSKGSEPYNSKMSIVKIEN